MDERDVQPHDAEPRRPGRWSNLIGMAVGAVFGAILMPVLALCYYGVAGGFASAADAALWGVIWGPVWGGILGVFERAAGFARGDLATAIGAMYGSIPAAVHLQLGMQWWLMDRAAILAIVGPMMVGILLGAALDRIHQAVRAWAARRST
jgi:hypothetical protein